MTRRKWGWILPESTRSASLNRTRRASLLASGPFASDSAAPNSKRIRLTAPPADSSARRVGLAVAAAFLHHRRRPHRRTRHHRRAERRRATTAVVSALRVRVSEVDLAWRVHVPATRVSTVFPRTTARARRARLHPALLLELVVPGRNEAQRTIRL